MYVMDGQIQFNHVTGGMSQSDTDQGAVIILNKTRWRKVKSIVVNIERIPLISTQGKEVSFFT